MFDTVLHAGLEWQTRSIEPALGGTMADYEVKDSRLWLKPFHLEDTGADVPDAAPGAGFIAFMEVQRAKYRHVADPPVDVGFHGVLDLHRTLADRDAEGQYCFEYRRLIFVFGQLVSEAPITQDADRADGRGLAGDWMPNDPRQRMAWQLHALQGLVACVTGDPAMQTQDAEQSLAAMRQVEAAVKEAVASWQ